MPLKDLLFSSKGRIPRSTWWYFRLAVVGIIGGLGAVTVIVLSLSISTTMSDTSALTGLVVCVGAPVYLFVIFADIMVSIKRCHDRNRSGWFLLWSYVPSVIYTAFSLLLGPYSASYGYSSSSASGIAVMLNCILSLVSFGTGLWVLIELGFLKGTPGPNQYGPDPTMPAYMQGYPVAGQAGIVQPGAAQTGYSQPGAISPGIIPPEFTPPEFIPPEGGVRSGPIKECPYCGEAIDAGAAFCKYCGRAQV